MSTNKFKPMNYGEQNRYKLIERIKKRMGVNENTVIMSGLEARDTFSELLHSAFVPADLSDKEFISIYSYQGPGYKKVNSHLRNNKGLVRNTNEKTMVTKITDTWFEDYDCYVEGVIDGIDNVLNRTYLNQDIVVFRGIGKKGLINLGFESEDELLNCDFPVTYNDHQYLSSTIAPSGRFFEERPIIMCINIPKGTHACYIGSDVRFSGEGEIIVDRDTEILITGAERIDNKIYIYCKMKEKVYQNETNKDIKLSDNDDELLSKMDEVIHPKEDILDYYDLGDEDNFSL